MQDQNLSIGARSRDAEECLEGRVNGAEAEAPDRPLRTDNSRRVLHSLLTGAVGTRGPAPKRL